MDSHLNSDVVILALSGSIFYSYPYRVVNSGQCKNVPHPENTANKTALLSCKYPRLPAAPLPSCPDDLICILLPDLLFSSLLVSFR